MLQGKDIKIYQISDIKVSFNSIEFFLYDKLSHFNVIIDRIKCAKSYPFNKYQIRDYVGIDTSKIAKYSSWVAIDDTNVIARVVKPTVIHPSQRVIINDVYFGNGWVEEGE